MNRPLSAARDVWRPASAAALALGILAAGLALPPIGPVGPPGAGIARGAGAAGPALAASGWSGASAARTSAAAQPADAEAAPGVWKKYVVRSPSSGKIERFWVGHPPDLKPDGQYPTLYFLPGLLDTDDNWKSALEPYVSWYRFILVCPAVGGATWFMNSPAQPWMRWGDFLTEDLRAFIESHYPAARERGQRGIAGISAGGHAAFYHALARPDLYGSVSVLSGAMDLRGYAGAVGLDYWIGPRSAETAPLYADRSCLVLASRLQGPLPFELFLDSGDKDGALPQMEALRQVLEGRGAGPKWFVGLGAHNWTYWNTRASDHLAWHAEQFARNRRENRFTEATPAKGGRLEVLDALPQLAPAPATLERLQAAWGPARGLARAAVTGVPKEGAPLSRRDERYAQVQAAADLPGAAGHGPALHVYRVTLVVGTPLAKDGMVTLGGWVRNGRGSALAAIPAVELAVPGGEPQRKVEVRSRLALEFKAPCPLRGGFLAAIQPFDAAGRPVGEPVVGKVEPGSLEAERWTVAPQARLDLTVRLAGERPLLLGAVHEVRIEKEP